MDFQISEKMEIILGMINEFVDKELIPLESHITQTEFVDALDLFEEKRTLPSATYANSFDMSFSINSIISGICSVALGSNVGFKAPIYFASS